MLTLDNLSSVGFSNCVHLCSQVTANYFKLLLIDVDVRGPGFDSTHTQTQDSIFFFFFLWEFGPG